MGYRAKLLAVLAAGLTLAACAIPAAYAPRANEHGTGYSDQQLAGPHWRVTFTGNAVTKRETVEDYLLLHAAEVTRKAGYHWFAFDTRDTKTKTEIAGGDPMWPAGPGWYPWYRRHPWFNRWNDGFDVPIHVMTSYEAYAEIVVLTDEQAKTEPHAFSAQEIIDHIGPKAHPQDTSHPAQ